jgi:toxin YoeB
VKLGWVEYAWEDCLWWQGQDRKTLKRINTLIQEIARNGNHGSGA